MAKPIQGEITVSQKMLRGLDNGEIQALEKAINRAVIEELPMNLQGYIPENLVGISLEGETMSYSFQIPRSVLKRNGNLKKLTKIITGTIEARIEIYKAPDTEIDRQQYGIGAIEYENSLRGRF